MPVGCVNVCAKLPANATPSAGLIKSHILAFTIVSARAFSCSVKHANILSFVQCIFLVREDEFLSKILLLFS